MKFLQIRLKESEENALKKWSKVKRIPLATLIRKIALDAAEIDSMTGNETGSTNDFNHINQFLK